MRTTRESRKEVREAIEARKISRMLMILNIRDVSEHSDDLRRAIKLLGKAHHRLMQHDDNGRLAKQIREFLREGE